MTQPVRRSRAVARLAIVVLASVLAACSGRTGAIATGPSPTPGGFSSHAASLPSPTASLPSPRASSPSPTVATPLPSFDFDGATALRTGTHGTQQTEAGVTYYTADFAVPFTIRPGADWWVENNIRTLTSFERGPNEPEGPPDDLVQFVEPTKVVPPGHSDLIPAPSDLLAWLRARPDLVLTAPTSIVVAGIQGAMVEGTLRAGAALNPEGLVNLICGQLSECGYEGGQLIGVGPRGFYEFVVIKVRGTQVIIALSGPAAHPSTARKTFGAFLKTVAFPAG